MAQDAWKRELHSRRENGAERERRALGGGVVGSQLQPTNRTVPAPFKTTRRVRELLASGRWRRECYWDPTFSTLEMLVRKGVLKGFGQSPEGTLLASMGQVNRGSAACYRSRRCTIRFLLMRRASLAPGPGDVTGPTEAQARIYAGSPAARRASLNGRATSGCISKAAHVPLTVKPGCSSRTRAAAPLAASSRPSFACVAASRK